MKRELMWRLLSGPQGGLLRQVGLAGNSVTQAGRAIQWMRSHYAEPIEIEILAGIASMNKTSFCRHFRAVTSMSRLRYQKHMRLHEARRRLAVTINHAATTDYEPGYQSAPQFNREYRRLFGMSPGQDRLRLQSMSRARLEDVTSGAEFSRGRALDHGTGPTLR